MTAIEYMEKQLQKHRLNLERESGRRGVTEEMLHNIQSKISHYEGAVEALKKGVVLPCKVGDTVWSWLNKWRKEDGVAPYQITNITITQNKKGVWTKKYRAMWLVDGKTRDVPTDFSFEDIGKTVFLTREEAEAALKKVGDS